MLSTLSAHSEGSCHHSLSARGGTWRHVSQLSQKQQRTPPRLEAAGSCPSSPQTESKAQVCPPLPWMPAASQRWGLVQRREHSGGPLPSLGLPHAPLLQEDGGKLGVGSSGLDRRSVRDSPAGAREDTRQQGSAAEAKAGRWEAGDTSGDRENLEDEAKCVLNSGRVRPNLSAASGANASSPPPRWGLCRGDVRGVGTP